ncbi:hypothetical protein [Pyramidobacter sp.]|uniref:hypothetical protein n=1 Tax=Pyramidobacter sp. TaxID=1943581 RepID=UPI00332D3547
MKVIHRPSDDEVRDRRRAEYLRLWPVERQLEAYAEAAAGRPEKVEKMREDFAAIREALPFCEKDGEKS